MAGSRVVTTNELWSSVALVFLTLVYVYLRSEPAHTIQLIPRDVQESAAVSKASTVINNAVSRHIDVEPTATASSSLTMTMQLPQTHDQPLRQPVHASDPAATIVSTIHVPTEVPTSSASLDTLPLLASAQGLAANDMERRQWALNVSDDPAENSLWQGTYCCSPRKMCKRFSAVSHLQPQAHDDH